MTHSSLNKAFTLKTGLREIGVTSRAKVLHTSVQWDGLTAVNGAVEKMIHIIIKKPVMELPALR